MITNLTKLLYRIESGVIPLTSIFDGSDCDQLLDVRDSSPEFDQKYRESYDLIEKLKSTLDTDPTVETRKQSFLIVSSLTQQHEIASYVSDDFELIAWASYSREADQTDKVSTPLIEWLLTEYENGRFPVPPFNSPVN